MQSLSRDRVWFSQSNSMVTARRRECATAPNPFLREFGEPSLNQIQP
jgi:hypothetical protein